MSSMNSLFIEFIDELPNESVYIIAVMSQFNIAAY